MSHTLTKFMHKASKATVSLSAVMRSNGNPTSCKSFMSTWHSRGMPPPSSKVIKNTLHGVMPPEDAEHVFRKAENNIDKYESVYNHHVFWPSIETAVDSASWDGLVFLTGELNLKCFKRHDVYYNADGIAFYIGLGVALLETSGAFNLLDQPRWAYDHVKSAFGL
ncbi:hypothetical protein BJV82DRAFT_669639 [Fennellomyces sp. T-0311]|nr:hypothetical protein BJV82DRAFT_669639 [Fennellomyces sp. T-0311]